ncbi:MAG: fluoride efflux transporter CrcB [Prevotella sp.]
MDTIRNIFLVALGGALGSVARFLLSKSMQESLTSNFPFATFTVNVLGCLLIGILYGLFDRNLLIGRNLSLLLITGFCGGFTTFSTFSNESLSLFRQGEMFHALLYVGSSVPLGLMAVYAGMYLVEKF